MRYNCIIQPSYALDKAVLISYSKTYLELCLDYIVIASAAMLILLFLVLSISPSFPLQVLSFVCTLSIPSSLWCGDFHIY